MKWSVGWSPANTMRSTKRLQVDSVEPEDAPGYYWMTYLRNGALIEVFCGFMEYVRISSVVRVFVLKYSLSWKRQDHSRVSHDLLSLGFLNSHSRFADPKSSRVLNLRGMSLLLITTAIFRTLVVPLLRLSCAIFSPSFFPVMATGSKISPT